MTLTEEAKAKLKAEFGDNIAVQMIGGEPVVVRPPTRMEWHRYRQERATKGLAAEITVRENFVAGCILQPKGPAIEAMYEKYPTSIEELFGLVTELGSGSETAAAKKL